jgi:hypothetical protein
MDSLLTLDFSSKEECLALLHGWDFEMISTI